MHEGCESEYRGMEDGTVRRLWMAFWRGRLVECGAESVSSPIKVRIVVEQILFSRQGVRRGSQVTRLVPEGK